MVDDLHFMTCFERRLHSGELPFLSPKTVWPFLVKYRGGTAFHTVPAVPGSSAIERGTIARFCSKKLNPPTSHWSMLFFAVTLSTKVPPPL